MCSMVEDMETQLRGTVFVMYQIGKFEYDPPPDLFNGYTTLVMEGSPVRFCGMHYCLENPIMKSIARVVLAVMGSEVRARYRFHEGKRYVSRMHSTHVFGCCISVLLLTQKKRHMIFHRIPHRGPLPAVILWTTGRLTPCNSRWRIEEDKSYKMVDDAKSERSDKVDYRTPVRILAESTRCESSSNRFTRPQ